jgi:MFS family permease
MVGGGMTPILAAGFNEVAETYGIEVHRVALSTGLYMMGMGIGGVVVSPTAIQFGKRPVYLVSCVLFILSSIWCALSPNFASLIVARIFQGIAVSPVEVLPSATIAEIFFLHERAYRLGIYTLLLLGGKNLIPLVSAAVIQSLSWRWVFWIVAIVLGFGGILLFFFVPETFWDRTPRAKQPHKHHLSLSKLHLPHILHHPASTPGAQSRPQTDGVGGHFDKPPAMQLQLPTPKKRGGEHHVAFDAPSVEASKPEASKEVAAGSPRADLPKLSIPGPISGGSTPKRQSAVGTPLSSWKSPTDWDIVDDALPTKGVTPDLHNLNSPWYVEKANDNTDYFALSAEPESGPPTANIQQALQTDPPSSSSQDLPTTPAPVLKLPTAKRKSKTDKTLGIQLPDSQRPTSSPMSTAASPTRSSLADIGTTSSTTMPTFQSPVEPVFNEKFQTPETPETEDPEQNQPAVPAGLKYTEHFRAAPPKTYKEILKPYHGRLSHDNWFRIAARPFVLYLYPSILWSAMVYSLSVGWLIVLSESVAVVYKNSASYNFTSIQTGLVYLSPFIGGILGTAVAGKVSDIIVRFMARRNDGVYEPEFRLVMAIPIAITSVIGLMGFGWSAEERDMWFVPTFFFGVISFGCSLGSTTAITFAVDSYRQYAGEALVTLNFAKSERILSIRCPTGLEKCTVLIPEQTSFMASSFPCSSRTGLSTTAQRTSSSSLASYSWSVWPSPYPCTSGASEHACGLYART